MFLRNLDLDYYAKPAVIRRLLRGDLNPIRSREWMRAAGRPT
jgi:hypothetical protein